MSLGVQPSSGAAARKCVQCSGSMCVAGQHAHQMHTAPAAAAAAVDDAAAGAHRAKVVAQLVHEGAAGNGGPCHASKSGEAVRCAALRCSGAGAATRPMQSKHLHWPRAAASCGQHMLTSPKLPTLHLISQTTLLGLLVCTADRFGYQQTTLVVANHAVPPLPHPPAGSYTCHPSLLSRHTSGHPAFAAHLHFFPQHPPAPHFWAPTGALKK